MHPITIQEFDSLILDNRFITSEEIAWYKDQKQASAIGVIIRDGSTYQALTYRRNKKSLFWLDKFKNFSNIKDAQKFLSLVLVPTEKKGT